MIQIKIGAVTKNLGVMHPTKKEREYLSHLHETRGQTQTLNLSLVKKKNQKKKFYRSVSVFFEHGTRVGLGTEKTKVTLLFSTFGCTKQWNILFFYFWWHLVLLLIPVRIGKEFLTPDKITWPQETRVQRQCLITWPSIFNLSFYLTTMMRKNFVETTGFEDIKSVAGVWEWLEGPFIDSVYSSPMTYNRMVSVPRMRMQKVRPDSCVVHEDFQDEVINFFLQFYFI